MVNILSLIFEIIPTILGVFGAIILLKKNSKYLANRLMAIGTFFIGCYSFFIFLYDLLEMEWAILLFLPIAMSFILLGTMSIYFAILVISRTSSIFKNKWRWVPFLVVSILYSIYFNVNPSIITIKSMDPVDSSVDLPSVCCQNIAR